MEMMFSVFHLISLIISFADPCFILCNFSRSITYDGFSGQFFRIFVIIILCFVVLIFHLVHDVEARNSLC